MQRFYKFSHGRMWAVCATKCTHELMESIRKLADPSWSQRHAEKCSYSLSLLFSLPKSYLSSLGKSWAQSGPDWWFQRAHVVPLAATCVKSPSHSFCRTLFQNRAWSCPLWFRQQQPLSTGSCSTSHLESLPDFSRLASACGRGTWSSSPPCHLQAS